MCRPHLIPKTELLYFFVELWRGRGGDLHQGKLTWVLFKLSSHDAVFPLSYGNIYVRRRQRPLAREWRPTKKERLLQPDDLRAQRVLGLLHLPGPQPGLRHRQRGQLRQPGDQLLRLLAGQHLQVREKARLSARVWVRKEKSCLFREEVGAWRPQNTIRRPFELLVVTIFSSPVFFLLFQL